MRRPKVHSAHFSKSYGTFGYSLQGQPSSIVCCRSLFFLHWVLIQQADVRFVTGCVTQRRVVLSVANISKNEANDPSNESIWRGEKQQNQKLPGKGQPGVTTANKDIWLRWKCLTQKMWILSFPQEFGTKYCNYTRHIKSVLGGLCNILNTQIADAGLSFGRWTLRIERSPRGIKHSWSSRSQLNICG